ncbi:multiple ankyrin repeats single kh domain [Fusarium longipes]|uniref:Multiple ankyrin repeats single kh domain n=1 Tax=Fusarium longipes TaxID=694270 RepID=A0A395T963_9HYPO|nr:multiple ankyrin repeats single kh domain [Fusarium longipes]
MPQTEIYTIGWICALSKELTAAKTFLDTIHDPVGNSEIHDDNSYTLGSIGKHNVVLAVLPYGQYGLVNAAAALKDMTRTFFNLRAVLIVGIGGGVPGKKDIRLGDIVVGSVGQGSGGVIQYDYGRAVQEEEFAITSHLNQPPIAFLTAMSNLQTTYEMEGHNIDSNIDKALQKYKRLRKKYSRPKASTDRLYKPDFVHTAGEGAGCSESCGDDQLVHREERDEDDDNPAVHYGLIASSNQLMKDASLRDKLAAKHGILCFEMEAAGLMNHFPCVVIRGICDYSDSHKNDEWQEYAAMVAAAYTKDLLLQVAPSSVQKEERIETLLGKMDAKIDDVRQIATETHLDIKSLSSTVQDDAIFKWLNPADPFVDQNKARQLCHLGTGQWLLNSCEYLNWKSQEKSFLWLNGNSGRGKTVLSSTIIEDLRSDVRSQRSSCAILYFYITFTNSRKQSLDSILRSLIYQIYQKGPETEHTIVSLYSKCSNGKSQPTVQELDYTFRVMLTAIENVFIVIDALDEYQNQSAQRYELLSWIKSFHYELTNTHLLVTSRPEHDIQTSIESWADSDSIVSLRTDGVGRDISDYVRDEDAIVNTLTTKANGVFRWVALQLERLKDCISREEVNATLETLPETLQETYYRVLSGFTGTRRKYVIRILQFLAYSDIPLSLEAAVDALVVNPAAPPGSRFVMRDRLPIPTEISSLCSTLFVAVPEPPKYGFWGGWTDETMILQLSHSSVKEFILSCPNIHFDGLLIERADVNFELDDRSYYSEIYRDYRPEGSILCAAVRTGDIELISFLVENDADVNAEQGYFRTRALEEAANLGHSDIVIYLFETGADINARSGWRNALAAASSNGHSDVVKYLVDQGADVITHSVDTNALVGASGYGYLDIVIYLLENGADIIARSDHPEALIAASSNGHLDIVKYLVDQGANVNTHSSDTNALVEASRYGCLDLVKYLLQQGADINARPGECTSLEAASCKGHLEVVIFLIGKGASVNTGSKETDSALAEASYYGHLNIVRYLLEKGADINAQITDGFQGGPLYNASFNGHLDIVMCLLEARADVKAQGGEFGAPLCGASYNGHLDIVICLLEAGADVNAPGGACGAALCCASWNGHLDIITCLLKAGADVNAQGGDFGPALCGASSVGRLDIVKCLLEAGADLNAEDGEGSTALCNALFSGHLDTVRCLLDAGANVNTQEGYYDNLCTTTHYDIHIIERLIEAGAKIDLGWESS